MQAHGRFSFEVVNNTVHSYPVGDINVEGIHEFHRAVLAIAPKNQPWVIIDHAKDVARATPEATIELIKCYNDLASNGCQGVFLEVYSLFHQVAETVIFPQVTNLYFEFAKDGELLLQNTISLLQNNIS